MYANIMRLVNDVEVKSVLVDKESRSVLNNRVAISDLKDQTTFINITAWGSLADHMGRWLKKGDEFFAEGELRNNTMPVYDEKGEKKEIQTVFLLIDKIKFTHGNKNINKNEKDE